MDYGEFTLASACIHVEHNKTANLEKCVKYIEEAAEEGAGFVVFPEMVLQGYPWSIGHDDQEQKKYFLETSETVPGLSTTRISRYAATHELLVQIGLAERVAVGGYTVLYNSVALIGPKGILGVVRKVHNRFERLFFESGNSFPIFDTAIGKVGGLICADINFPESLRVLALEGADIVAHSSANVSKYGYFFDLVGKANAFMNQIWLIQSNQVGVDKKSANDYFGHSRIIAPSGKVLAEIGHEEGLVTATVNIKKGIKKARTESFWGQCFLENRRPDCYGIICRNP
jgi:predicted amidohydrolase